MDTGEILGENPVVVAHQSQARLRRFQLGCRFNRSSTISQAEGIQRGLYIVGVCQCEVGKIETADSERDRPILEGGLIP